MFYCVFYVLGDPTNDPNIYGDPFKTLFVARIVSILLLVILFMGDVTIVV